MEIQIISKPQQVILSITTAVASEEMGEVIGESYLKLAEQIEQAGAKITDDPFVSFKKLDEKGGLYLKPVEIEIGIPINQMIAGTNEITAYERPAYQAVSATFVGDDADLTLVYELLIEKIKELGKQYLRYSYEYYLGSAANNPNENTTKIELPFA